jgi:tRNA U34 2-thiouridine synthase MnmA/TrmU
VPGLVRPTHDDGSAWRVELDVPAWAPAPGQAAVFYAAEDDARVIGGGRIGTAPTSDDAGGPRRTAATIAAA